MTDETTETRRSKRVIATFTEDGDAQIEMDAGITSFTLYGLAGWLTYHANLMESKNVADQARRQGGIVVPTRQ